LTAGHAHSAARDDSSSWVLVHEGGHWPCEWEIRPGTEPGTYRIVTCGHEAGKQPAGWGLSAWNAATTGAKRSDHFSRVAVHSGDHWPCDWTFKVVQPAPTAALKPSAGGPIVGGVYEIIPRHAEHLRADCQGAGKQNGTKVLLWSENGGPNQKWQAHEGRDGKLSFRPMHSPGLSLDGGVGGQQLTIQQCGEDKALWSVTPTDGAWFTVQNAGSKTVLDVAEGNTKQGGTLVTWELHGGYNQQFRFSRVGGAAALPAVVPTTSPTPSSSSRTPKGKAISGASRSLLKATTAVAGLPPVQQQPDEGGLRREESLAIHERHERMRREQDEAEATFAEQRKEQQRQAQLLEEQIAGLKQVAALAQHEAKAKAERAAATAATAGVRTTPSYWSANADSTPGVTRIELTQDPQWRQRFQQLLDGTCRRNTLGAGRDQIIKSGKYDRLVFHKAWRLENAKLYGLYAAHRDHQVTAPKEQVYAQTHDLPTSQWMADEAGLRTKDRNEVYLWHGTKPEAVDIISHEGFDERVCNLGGLFGAGVYLADEVSKSDQYTTPTPPNDPYNGVYHIFLVRGTMGKFEKVSTGTKEARRAPAGCQSVLGQIDKNKYREYIIYDGWLAYPEYIIEYKRQYTEKGTVKKK
jgi:hypothetical protein